MDNEKGRIRSHRDLIVWQRAMELANETYRLTEAFPSREIYGIVSQMRRAAVSIPANIAEGHGRPTRADFLRFIGIANSSLRELDTYFELCVTRHYAEESDVACSRQLAGETGKMLSGLRDALRRRGRDNQP